MAKIFGLSLARSFWERGLLMAKQTINPRQSNKQYSTSEVLTGDVWIDGRPVYRKVIQGVTNVTVAGNTASIAHGITGITNSFVVISAFTFLKIGQGGGTSQSAGQPSGYFEGTSTPTNQVALTSVDSTTINIKFGYGGWGNTWSSTVLEYVK